MYRSISTFFAASQDGAGYDLRRIFDGSLTAENPVHSVTFVDNHDTQKDRLWNPASECGSNRMLMR